MVNPIRALKALVDKIPHWALLVLAAGVGASFSFFQAEPNEKLVAALTSWALLVPMLKGAGVAFAGTTIALLKTAPWTRPDVVVRAPGVPPPLPVLLLGLALALAIVACAHDAMTPQDHVLLGFETKDDLACVELYRDAGRAAVEACRVGVQRGYDGYWRAALADAGGDR